MFDEVILSQRNRQAAVTALLADPRARGYDAGDPMAAGTAAARLADIGTAMVANPLRVDPARRKDGLRAIGTMSDAQLTGTYKVTEKVLAMEGLPKAVRFELETGRDLAAAAMRSRNIRVPGTDRAASPPAFRGRASGVER